MKVKFMWDSFNNPVGMSLDALLYRIRVNDADGQVFDSVEMADVLFDADELMPVFDALYAPYARLERKVNQLKMVMDKASNELTVASVTTSDPFKQNGSVQVATIFTLSDGQTVTIYFHNPDSTPDKLLPNDVLVSWKWMLNKKDITIVVAPENGRDVNVREVGARIMKLAAKNSAIFTKKSAKKEEDKQLISSLETEVTELENKLTDLNTQIDLAKQAKDEAELKAVNVGLPDNIDELLSYADSRRYFSEKEAKEIIEKLNDYFTGGWKASKTFDELKEQPLDSLRSYYVSDKQLAYMQDADFQKIKNKLINAITSKKQKTASEKLIQSISFVLTSKQFEHSVDTAWSNLENQVKDYQAEKEDENKPKGLDYGKDFFTEIRKLNPDWFMKAGYDDPEFLVNGRTNAKLIWDEQYQKVNYVLSENGIDRSYLSSEYAPKALAEMVERDYWDDVKRENKGYVVKHLAELETGLIQAGYQVNQLDAHSMNIVTPLSNSEIEIELDEDGDYITTSKDSGSFSDIDLSESAATVVYHFDQIDFILSLPDVDENNEIESGVFQGKTVEYARAIQSIDGAVKSIPELDIVFSDFNNSLKNGGLFDSVVLDSLNENSNLVYGVTAQVGVVGADKVLCRFNVDLLGDITIYKDASGDDRSGRFSKDEKNNIAFTLNKLLKEASKPKELTLAEKLPELAEYLSSFSDLQKGKILKSLNRVAYSQEGERLTVAENIIKYVKTKGAVLGEPASGGKALMGDDGSMISAKKWGLIPINFGAWLVEKGYGGQATKDNQFSAVVDALNNDYLRACTSFSVTSISVKKLLDSQGTDLDLLLNTYRKSPMLSSMSAAEIAETKATSVITEWDNGYYTHETRSLVDDEDRERLQEEFEKKYPETIEKFLKFFDDLVALRERAVMQVKKEAEPKGNDTKNDVTLVTDPATGYINAKGDDDPATSKLIKPAQPKGDDLNSDENIKFLNELIANPNNYADRDNLKKIRDLKGQYVGTENESLVSEAIKVLQEAVFAKLKSAVVEVSE